VQIQELYEFKGCYWHRHTCLPFRDVKTRIRLRVPAIKLKFEFDEILVIFPRL
jgi:G:T-mismatch repair DNA endonuclease (very short patch repair protein)